MGLCLMRMFFCRICCAGMMNVRAMYRFFDSPSMYRFPKLVATCFEIPAEPYRNRGVPRGIRHGHHAVDHLLQGREIRGVSRIAGLQNGQIFAILEDAEGSDALSEADSHLHARFVDRDVVHHAVRTRQIDVFEDAWRAGPREGVDLRVQVHLHVDKQRFACSHVAFALDSDRFQRDALRSRREFDDAACVVAFHAEAERTARENSMGRYRMPWGSRKISMPTPLISTTTA